VSVPRLTLTFDNGPTPGVTERVLDVLGERGLRATFFVVGTDLLLPGRRELAERAAREGHWHGNHTMTHSIQFGDSDDPALPEREVGDAQQVLAGLSHVDKFFRPWGDGRISRSILSTAVIDYLRSGGYTCVLWNCVPRDWEDPQGWPERALATIAALDWTVLVVHDQDTGAMDALPGFLDRALERGVEFTQDFPDSCVPIRRGRPTGPLEHLHQPSAGGHN
jgi:peptidoglycan/xylan/chitin deacetylase (PgdA/CDA1 family)